MPQVCVWQNGPAADRIPVNLCTGERVDPGAVARAPQNVEAIAEDRHYPQRFFRTLEGLILAPYRHALRTNAAFGLDSFAFVIGQSR